MGSIYKRIDVHFYIKHANAPVIQGKRYATVHAMCMKIKALLEAMNSIIAHNKKMTQICGFKSRYCINLFILQTHLCRFAGV